MLYDGKGKLKYAGGYKRGKRIGIGSEYTYSCGEHLKSKLVDCCRKCFAKFCKFSKNKTAPIGMLVNPAGAMGSGKSKPKEDRKNLANKPGCNQVSPGVKQKINFSRTNDNGDGILLTDKEELALDTNFKENADGDYNIEPARFKTPDQTSKPIQDSGYELDSYLNSGRQILQSNVLLSGISVQESIRSQRSQRRVANSRRSLGVYVKSNPSSPEIHYEVQWAEDPEPPDQSDWPPSEDNTVMKIRLQTINEVIDGMRAILELDECQKGINQKCYSEYFGFYAKGLKRHQMKKMDILDLNIRYHGEDYYDSAQIKYKGYWWKHKKDGRGKFYYNGLKNIPMYAGEWKQNRAHGYGMVYDSAGKCIFEGNFDCGTIVDGIIDPFVNENTEQPIFCSSFLEQLENDNSQRDVAVKRPNGSFNDRKDSHKRGSENFMGKGRGSMSSLHGFKQDGTQREVINVSSEDRKPQDSSPGGRNWLLNYKDPNGGMVRKS